MRRVLIVGAGQVGFYVAERLSKKLKADIRRGELEIVVVEPDQHMTYQPFLPEAAAGNISPRHGVVQLRRDLRRCSIIAGKVSKVDHAARVATVQPIVGPAREIEYDQIVVAPGSVSRSLPIPGLAESAVGFKNMGEAIYLRNHVLRCLDVAAATPDEGVRRRALSFLFIGGGFSGVETMAELEDMIRTAMRDYEELRGYQPLWMLLDASNRILPEVGAEMGAYAVQRLLKRDFDIRLNTTLKSCEGGHVVLSDGTEFDSDTIVWTAGVKPHPMLRDTDLPLGPKGHLRCRATLQVEDDDGVVEGAWGGGDSAQVPDLSGSSQFCAPNAQHAVRQAKVLAHNLAARLYERPVREYKHKYIGSVASLGLYKGVAHVYGIKLRGLPAWFMHRSYHLMKVPGLGRKVRILADWTLAIFTKREVVQLGEIHNPRKPWEAVASGKQPPEGTA